MMSIRRSLSASPSVASGLAAFCTLTTFAMPSFARADTCAVWPDRALRVNSESNSNVLFLLHTRTRAGAPAISEVGGRFLKRDPNGQCRPGNTSAACRSVGVWTDYRALLVPSPTGEREDSITFFLGSQAAPFLYEGVFYVQYADGGREWLHNPTDSGGNFWFTQDSTVTLPQSSTWDFNMSAIPRTADIAHWSNPSRCVDSSSR